MSTAADRAPSRPRSRTTVTELRGQVLEQAAALTTGEDWTRLLRYLDHFRPLGATNALLILRNRPHATELATYEQWQSRGRQVRRGEHGLALIDPGNPGRVARLFDITQTGAPPAALGPLTHLRPVRHAPRDLQAALTSIAERRGFTIGRAPGRASASTTWPDRTINLHPALTDEAACYALAHELAHVLLHKEADFRTGTADCSGLHFVEAESTAFLVCRASGIDVNAFAFPPPPSWAGTDLRTNTARTILAAAERIATTAGSLTTQIDAINNGRAWKPTATPAGTTKQRPKDKATTDQPTAEPSGPSATARKRDSIRPGQQAGTAKPSAADRPRQSATPDRAPVQAGAEQRTGAERRRSMSGDRHSAEERPERGHRVGVPAGGAGRPDPALYEIHATAERFFIDHLPGSWVPGYLAARGLAAALDDGAPWGIGYAPASWTALVDHLRARGHAEDQIIASGLGKRSRTGGLIDRFRDRAMIPVRAPDGTTIAFIGRANPDASPPDGHPLPKYLNSPQTPIYTKGAALYGLDVARPRLAAGATPVLVEGTLDAIAVATADTEHRYAPVAPSGTALTRAQVTALAHATNLAERGVLVAFDGDTAGQRAAARAHGLLREVTTDPRRAVLPAGADPADILRDHGPHHLTAALADQRPLAELVLDAHLTETADHRPWECRDQAGALIADLTPTDAATAIRHADAAGTCDPLKYAPADPRQAVRLLPTPTLALITRASDAIGVPATELTNAVVEAINERAFLQREPPQELAESPAALARRDTPHGLVVLTPAARATAGVPGTTRVWAGARRAPRRI